MNNSVYIYIEHLPGACCGRECKIIIVGNIYEAPTMFQAVKSTSCISSFKPYNNLANTVSIAILQMRKQDGRDLPRVLELVGSLVRVEILVVLTHKPISFSLSFVVITRIKGRENNKLVELFRHPGGNVGQRYK